MRETPFSEGQGAPLYTTNGRFNGRIYCHVERLSIPLKRRKPTVYAVWNDLFHPGVPVNFLEEVLATITLLPQHTFLILTKRAGRLNLMTSDRLRISRTDTWPIKNLWLGLTICNQHEADEKIPIFLQVPGKKFFSIEPMLGAIDLHISGKLEDVIWRRSHGGSYERSFIDSVILGGETGPGARPMHPDWIRSVRDQCQNAGVPFFLKQWGEWAPDCLCDTKKQHETVQRSNGKMGVMFRCGRTRAGRLLDGRTHDDLPWREQKPDCTP
jgi:protein gp37